LEPELVPEPEPEDPVAIEEPALRESETKELEESPLDPEEESQGVNVVVMVTRRVAASAPLATPTNAARTMVRVDAMMAS